jgi:hypothetical protein
MPVDVRPAMLLALPQVGPAKAKRNRLRWWFATVVTVLAASVAIVLVAVGAVMLGMS